MPLSSFPVFHSSVEWKNMGQMPSPAHYSRLLWTNSLSLPECILSFQQEGLVWNRNGPFTCSTGLELWVPSIDLSCPLASDLSFWPCWIIPAVPSPRQGPFAEALVSGVIVRPNKKISPNDLLLLLGVINTLGAKPEWQRRESLTLCVLHSACGKRVMWAKNPSHVFTSFPGAPHDNCHERSLRFVETYSINVSVCFQTNVSVCFQIAFRLAWQE